MFKKFKNHYSEDSYKKFLENILVDSKLKDEIISQINIFSEEGKVNFDGNNLFGKIIKKEGNDYLEIRYENDYFICNYTTWGGKRIISITQIDLKNGNVKIDKKEKTEYTCPQNENETTTSELEKIYDRQHKLVYESKLEYENSYESLESSLIYDAERHFSNSLELEKCWYIPNGSIIKHRLCKRYMCDDSKIEETYSICRLPYNDGSVNVLNFIDLKEELFKAFMSGKITISELLEQNTRIQKQKVK